MKLPNAIGLKLKTTFLRPKPTVFLSRNRLSLGWMLGCLFLLTGCDPGELPGPVYDRGDVISAEAVLGPTYRQQVWFDLGTNRVVKTNNRTDWDLAFDCGAGNSGIYLNTALVMKAALTNTTDFAAVKSATGLDFTVDYPSGNRDSLAIGNWQHGKVYVIDRGYDENGNALGFCKIQFTGLQNDVFTFRYANLDGSNEHTGQVQKDSNYNTVAYSFNAHKQIQIEPLKTEYDLCFTNYTHVFLEPEFTPYSVTGILLNPYRTQAAKVTETDFKAITSAQIATAAFSSARDRIGYSWKVFNFTDNRYTVDPQKNYLVQDAEGIYYKLHFVGFYDSQGQKGTPKFEFRKL